MSSNLRWILLAMLIAALFIGVAKAQEDAMEEEGNVAPDVEEEEEEEEDYVPQQGHDGPAGIAARAFFEGQDIGPLPQFHAGEKITTHVAMSSAAENPSYDVFFVSASITHAQDPNYFIQNFSGTKGLRPIAGGETATFKYTFTPDENLDPHDYGLVVRLFFKNDNNQTFVAVGYNETITVLEPLGTDPKTVLTFVTIIGMIGGGYYLYTMTRKPTYKKASSPSQSTVEGGTKGGTYDPDYIANEHVKYQEAIKRNGSGSPTKRQVSSSPKRK